MAGPADAPFLGMRASNDYLTAERPENWREKIAMLSPNGKATLVALTAMMDKESTDDPHYHWFTEKLPEREATITGSFTDVLTTPYTSGGSDGDAHYLQMSEIDSKHFLPGQQVLIRLSTDLLLDTNAEVIAVVQNGANSYVHVELMEDDDNGAPNSIDLSDADTLKVTASMTAEGTTMPSSVDYDPTEFSSYTQIFETSLSITRTAAKTKLRTKKQYKRLRQKKLVLHGIDIEQAFVDGIQTIDTSGSEPKRTTMGFVEFMRANAPANCVDYQRDATYSGDAWTTSGEVWLDALIEQCFRYGPEDGGSGERIALCGGKALLAIQRLAKTSGTFELTKNIFVYGIKVFTWMTPFGDVHFKPYPLFNHFAATRNRVLVMDPSVFKYRYLDDTFYKPDTTRKAGALSKDALEEEWLTECGLEFHHPDMHLVLDGVGLDNTV